MVVEADSQPEMRRLMPRRMPIGAEPWGNEGAHFRVWAPEKTRISVRAERTGSSLAVVDLKAEGNGYFSALLPEIRTGDNYRFLIDDDPNPYPDPATRFQPAGPHGPSRVVDPTSFRWTDHEWRGRQLEGQVIYEMHLGTFTEDGTWKAATAKLDFLADLGITVLEIMPIVEFAGTFGWGYDGVQLFAPTRLYGDPDDVRQFVDRAHALGLAVILDVVYNHLGPDGNYLGKFTDRYFTDLYKTDWGAAINFDGDNAGPVREYFIANAVYWIDEYHLDGLRLDATQNIYDSSKVHILSEISSRVREAAKGRDTIVVGENEPQDVMLLRNVKEGGCGLDGLWNDDFHHSASVAMTGHSEAYYSDYHGTSQELLSAAKWHFLYQGQWYRWQSKPRGTPSLDLPHSAFIHFLQNHDQVANSARGLRRHRLTTPGRYRAMTAYLLLMPGTPMLFQGQEFNASSPFLFFADHEPDLAKLVHSGRREFLCQFPSISSLKSQSIVADPADRSTFTSCKLNWAECDARPEAVALHKDLILLRRDDPVIARPKRRYVDGAVLAPEAFLLRYFADDGNDRVLIVNLGRDLSLSPIPEPLLAPPLEGQWKLAWSSEDPKYGGVGVAAMTPDETWRIFGHSAVLLVPELCKK